MKKEEGYIVLKGQPSKRLQVNHGGKVLVAALGARQARLFSIQDIVHVPTKDGRAHAKTRLEARQELGFVNDLAAKEAIAVYASHFDFGVVG